MTHISVLEKDDLPRLMALVSQLDFSKDINYFRRCLENSDEGRVVLMATYPVLALGRNLVEAQRAKTGGPGAPGKMEGGFRTKSEGLDLDVGLCVVNFAPNYTLFRRLNIPEIQDLNVHKDARGQGVGAALVRAAEDLARARGHTEIGIGVGLTAGYGAAQKLYVKLGYVPDGLGIAADGVPVRPSDLRAVDDAVSLYMVKGF
jgi:GNAT superfamily N-acetyltransferase